MICAGKSYEFKEGDIFIVNSGNTHITTTTGILKYHCLIIDYNFLQNSGIDVSETEFCALINDKTLTQLYINKAYLSRIFKKETNKTIVDFINIVRCDEAKKLLSEGYSAKETASLCSFLNLSYFTKTYKAYTGTLPSHEKTKGM